MEFSTHLYFVTPVFKRFDLTDACLRQRRELLDALPFQASQVVIGDDPKHRALAESLGFDWVEHPNDWVSAKFNAGYRHGIESGATHLMPIGSDSWLHTDAFGDVEWDARGALGLLGLSSVSPYGDERIDFMVKYPAGFGVGMVYPSWAIQKGGGADPTRNKGIDTSTWSRCGRGRVQIVFHENPLASYINFHSPDTQITDYASIRATYRRNGKTKEPWEDLRERYGDENVDRVVKVYAAHEAVAAARPGGRQMHPDREHRIPPLPGHKGRQTHRVREPRVPKVRDPAEQGYPYGGDKIAERRRARIERNFEDALSKTP